MWGNHLVGSIIGFRVFKNKNVVHTCERGKSILTRELAMILEIVIANDMAESHVLTLSTLLAFTGSVTLFKSVLVRKIVMKPETT